MLRCIPRSILHVGAPSRLQCRLGTSSNFSVDTAIAARGKPAIGPCLPSFCTRGAQRLSSPTTGSMRPMSSAVISARRGGRNDKPSTFKGKIGAESIVAPTGELPANLKLAVDVQVSLDEERERHEEQKEGQACGVICAALCLVACRVSCLENTYGVFMTCKLGRCFCYCRRSRLLSAIDFELYLIVQTKWPYREYARTICVYSVFLDGAWFEPTIICPLYCAHALASVQRITYSTVCCDRYL